MEAAMDLNLPVAAGAISTVIFAVSTLPMLVKAARTKDLGSYSLGNILLANVGNVIHSVYVFDLPAGPVWVLHTFYLISTGLMLVWYVRYALRRKARAATSPRRDYTGLPTPRRHRHVVVSPDAAGVRAL
jgi:uncharacterized protein with PQ loop repeat